METTNIKKIFISLGFWLSELFLWLMSRQMTAIPKKLAL
jgi:hypothetical protein